MISYLIDIQNKNNIDYNKLKELDDNLIPTDIYNEVKNKDIKIINEILNYDEKLQNNLRKLFGNFKMSYEFIGRNLKSRFTFINYNCYQKKNISNILNQNESSDFHKFMIISGKNNSYMSFLNHILGNLLQINSLVSYNRSNNLNYCFREKFFIPHDIIEKNYLESLKNNKNDILNNLLKDELKIKNIDINKNIIYIEILKNSNKSLYYSINEKFIENEINENYIYIDNLYLGKHEIIFYLIEEKKIINFKYKKFIINNILLENSFDNTIYVNVKNNKYIFCNNKNNNYSEDLILNKNYTYLFKIIIKNYPFNIGKEWKKPVNNINIISDSNNNNYKIGNVCSIEAPHTMFINIPENFDEDLYYYNFNDENMKKKIIINKKELNSYI